MPKSPPQALEKTDDPRRRRRRPSGAVRALLLDAARAEFERAGYAGATTAGIAFRAQATEAQLFRYFGSKAELFRAAVLDPIERAFAQFNETCLAALPVDEPWTELTGRYIAELSAFIEQHRHLLMSLIVAQAYGGETVEGVDKVGGLHAYFDVGEKRMRRYGLHTPRVDPSLIVRVSFGAVLASVLFRDWMFGDARPDDGAIDAALVHFVRDGLRVNYPTPKQRAPAAARQRSRKPPAQRRVNILD